MTTYLLPKARNTVTGQTVKTQDLTGTRFALNQRRLAQDMADQTAAKMSARNRKVRRLKSIQRQLRHRPQLLLQHENNTSKEPWLF